MPQVSQDDLTAFGTAVTRARSLRGWTLDQLGAAIDPPVGKSFVSKVEKGRKENLNSRTVGRFINALKLDESWIDRFLGVDTFDDSEETKVERDADRILDRLAREKATKGASEELLIQLANSYAEGTHRDLQTAYESVRTALETFSQMKAQQALGGNADDQFAAVMAEVARLNDAGEVDAAGDALDEAMDRIDQARDTVFQQQLRQDRLRNRPDLAAERLIADVRKQPDRGKLFWAVNALADEWQRKGDLSGDIFALRVALQIARRNWEKHKGKRGLEAAALNTLGWSYYRVAERSARPRDLELARNAFESALKNTSKAAEPHNWAAQQNGLGGVFMKMGERAANADMLRDAVAAHRAGLAVKQNLKAPVQMETTWNNLGTALQKLGEITKDPTPVTEAVTALETALSLEDKKADALNWETTQNNLALALRWQGALTKDRAVLDRARVAYRTCENVNLREQAAFWWASVQWNIADLALARFDLDPDPALLDEAGSYVRAAREVFVDGSDYQTQRCDDLISQIEAARGRL